MEKQPSLILYPRGCAKVDAERQRKGITPAEVQKRLTENLRKPF